MKELCSGSIQLGDNSSFWENENHAFYWDGIIFIKGELSGIDSIKIFSQDIIMNGIEKACARLSGVFFLVINDKESGIYHSIIDNSGLFQAFYSNIRISTSFLQLVKKENLKVSDLDKRSVVEFINLGNIFFNKTFFDSIKKIDGPQIISISSAGDVKILKKDIPDIFCKVEEESFLPIFEKIASSLKNYKNISVDLTSGLDSRLCAVLFDHFGLEFETAVSGVKGHPDVEYSSKVAQALGKEHHVTYPSMININETIEEVFEICDGLQPITSYFRLFQFQKDRTNRNIDLMITGTGGEILRDYFWVQDFPLYSKKKSNLNRLFDLRFRPIEPDHTYFSDEYIQQSKNLRNNFINDLSLFIKDTNTKTYDNIYVHTKIKEVVARGVTNNNRILKCYAPLLDYDIIRIALSLPINKKLYSNYHNEIIELLNPEVAKLKYPTKLYLSLLRYSFFMRDLIRYLTSLKRYIVFSVRLRSANDPNQSTTLKNLKITQKYIGFLYDAEILNKKVEPKAIDDEFFGRFLTLGMLIERIQK